MADAKLSKELALALGWLAVDMQDGGVLVAVKNTLHGPVRLFDYRDPTVCLPLIKWLMVEHWAMVWYSPCRICLMIPMDDHDGPIDVCADTLEKAVARAVIAVKGKP